MAPLFHEVVIFSWLLGSLNASWCKKGWNMWICPFGFAPSEQNRFTEIHSAVSAWSMVTKQPTNRCRWKHEWRLWRELLTTVFKLLNKSCSFITHTDWFSCKCLVKGRPNTTGLSCIKPFFEVWVDVKIPKFLKPLMSSGPTLYLNTNLFGLLYTHGGPASALQCSHALRWCPWWISKRIFASPDGSLIHNSSCVWILYLTLYSVRWNKRKNFT